MIATPFTRLTGCRVPIQQAAMGRVSGVDLAVAVAEAGALGMVSAEGTTTGDLGQLVMRVRARTSAPFGVNFLLPFLDDVASVDVAARHAGVVEFFFGDPDAGLVARVHRNNALAFWQVGSLGEALAAVGAGADVVVLQGVEAGGHLRGEVALRALLAEVVPRVKVPIVAAGGIGSAEAVATCLASGAAAVRVGTRFVAAEESDAHPVYVAALSEARAEDTTVTQVFSRSWPRVPHRVLGSCIDAVQRLASDVVAEYDDHGTRKAVLRFSGTEPTAAMSGNIEAMALYAGESVSHVRGRQQAASIVAELMAQVDPGAEGSAG